MTKVRDAETAQIETEEHLCRQRETWGPGGVVVRGGGGGGGGGSVLKVAERSISRKG